MAVTCSLMISPPSLLAILAAITVSACKPAEAPPAAGSCSPGAAGRLAHRSLPSEAEIRALTGASVIRMIAPGEPVTMDILMQRVTIEVDATRRIVAARCG